MSTRERPPSSGTSTSNQASVAKKAPSSSTRKTSDKYEGNPDHNLPGIGNYIFVKTVGEGNFAKVKLAKHKLTGQEVAIKIIDKTKLDEKKLSKLYREVRIMKLLHHPHIVKLYEVIETKSTVFLVMEYASGGELYDYLVVHGRMKEKEARAKFRQILSAVSYCHKKRVIHRDLKAENLLLDTNMNIKIADFGFSNYYDPDDKLDTFCGSPPYAAPELFQGRRYTGPEVDVWSLGVILYVLTTGCLPFDGKNLQEMRESVCRGKYRVPFYLSDGCEKLLRKFLVRDPSKRASLDIVVDDAWINDSYPDSPITQDLGTKVEEDDEIIGIMERKFGIERDQAIRALRENIYDDVAAVYHLLYHERETYRMAGESHPASNERSIASALNTGDDSTRSESPANTESSVASSAPAQASPLFAAAQTPPSYIANANGGGGRIAASTAAPSSTQEAPDAASGEEDTDTFPAGAGGAAAAAARKKAPRRRRFTVGGEADVVKYVDDEESLKAAEALKLKIPENGNNTQAGNPPLITTEDSSSQQSMTPSVASSQRKNSITEEGDEGSGESRRKRHNTFVGIFRNSIRKQSDAGTAASAAAAVAAATAAAAAASSNQAPSITSATESASGSVLMSGTITNPGEEGKPRSLRFTFNSNSTSSKPPDEVVKEVTDALKLHNVQYTMAGRYLINCSAQHGALKFEIEICKLPRLRNLHGLRFKRMAGQSADYKDICEKVLATVKL